MDEKKPSGLLVRNDLRPTTLQSGTQTTLKGNHSLKNQQQYKQINKQKNKQHILAKKQKQLTRFLLITCTFIYMEQLNRIYTKHKIFFKTLFYNTNINNIFHILVKYNLNIDKF